MKREGIWVCVVATALGIASAAIGPALHSIGPARAAETVQRAPEGDAYDRAGAVRGWADRVIDEEEFASQLGG